MVEHNLSTSVLRWGESDPTALAVVFGEEEISYGSLSLAARRASTLIAEVAGEGEWVGIYLPSCPTWLAMYLGLQDSGRVPVVLNGMLTAPELADICEQIELRAIVHDRSRSEEINRVRSLLRDRGATAPDAITVDTDGPVDDAFADHRVGEIQGRMAPAAAVMLTSGTTGVPKAAELTHTGLTLGTISGAWVTSLEARSRVLTGVPLFYDMGIHTLGLGTLTVGGTFISDRRFDAEGFVSLIDRWEPQVIAVTPTMVLRTVALMEEQGLQAPTTRAFASSGAALSGDAVRRVTSRFPNASVRQFYGLTETRMLTGAGAGEHQPMGSIGRPAPSIEVRLVDEAGQVITEPGIVGTLQTRYPGLMRRYANVPEEETFLPGGWFDTGDLIRRDEDGWLWFEGRNSELIVRGGANVYPREIEMALERHPGVSEAVVVAQPHSDLGEVPAAYFIPHGENPGEDVLLAHCRENLAAYKRPVSFTAVTEFPRTSSGKIRRHVLTSAVEDGTDP